MLHFSFRERLVAHSNKRINVSAFRARSLNAVPFKPSPRPDISNVSITAQPAYPLLRLGVRDPPPKLIRKYRVRFAESVTEQKAEVGEPVISLDKIFNMHFTSYSGATGGNDELQATECCTSRDLEIFKRFMVFWTMTRVLFLFCLVLKDII